MSTLFAPPPTRTATPQTANQARPATAQAQTQAQTQYQAIPARAIAAQTYASQPFQAAAMATTAVISEIVATDIQTADLKREATKLGIDADEWIAMGAQGRFEMRKALESTIQSQSLNESLGLAQQLAQEAKLANDRLKNKLDLSMGLTPYYLNPAYAQSPLAYKKLEKLPPFTKEALTEPNGAWNPDNPASVWRDLQREALYDKELQKIADPLDDKAWEDLAKELDPGIYAIPTPPQTQPDWNQPFQALPSGSYTIRTSYSYESLNANGTTAGTITGTGTDQISGQLIGFRYAVSPNSAQVFAKIQSGTSTSEDLVGGVAFAPNAGRSPKIAVTQVLQNNQALTPQALPQTQTAPPTLPKPQTQTLPKTQTRPATAQPQTKPAIAQPQALPAQEQSKALPQTQSLPEMPPLYLPNGLPVAMPPTQTQTAPPPTRTAQAPPLTQAQKREAQAAQQAAQQSQTQSKPKELPASASLRKPATIGKNRTDFATEQAAQKLSQQQQATQEQNRTEEQEKSDPCKSKCMKNLTDSAKSVTIQYRKFKACKSDGTPEYEQASLSVPASDSAAIRAQLEALADLQGANCNQERTGDATATVPEWWAPRPGSNRPQATLLLAEIFNSGKLGTSRWQLTIPHYNKPQGYKLKVPQYTRGDWTAILTLTDNSRLAVNAATAQEAKRLLNSLKLHIPVGLRTRNGRAIQPKITENPPGTYKRCKIQAIRLDYFRAGQAEGRTWYQQLR